MNSNENSPIVPMMHDKIDNSLSLTSKNYTQGVETLLPKLPSLDSFFVMIPIEKLKYISPEITRNVIELKIDGDTNEIIEQSVTDIKTNKKAIKVERQGYEFYIGYLSKNPLNGKGANQKDRQTKYYVSITVSSKMLKQHYFSGISIDTINLIVDEINSSGFVVLTKDVLLDAVVSDIDVKFDTYVRCQKEDIIRLFKGLHALRKPEYKFEGKISTTKSKIITGIGARNGNKEIVYNKRYNKLTELNYGKSTAFNALYLGDLKDCYNEQIIRQEVNIYGRNQAVKYGVVAPNLPLTLRRFLVFVSNEKVAFTIFAETDKEQYHDFDNINMDKKDIKPRNNRLSAEKANLLYDMVRLATLGGCNLAVGLQMAERFLNGSTDERMKLCAIDIAEQAYKHATEAMHLAEVVKDETLSEYKEVDSEITLENSIFKYRQFIS